MQMNRLFEIVYMLLNKKTVTAKELAEHFEVSVRTIYRDVDILSSAGIPIYASQGKGGGLSLLDDYILDRSVLSENEQNEILFALQSLSLTHVSEGDKVLAKLSNLFNKDKVNWIEVDFSPWGSHKAQNCEFTILKHAILNHRVIEFQYTNSFGEKSNRKVEPVRLIFKVNAWYLRGFCLTKSGYRTFKISRMSDLKITEEAFNARPWNESDEIIQARKSQKWLNMQLKISSHGAYRVFDEFDEEAISKNQDGSFTVVTSLPESEWLINYILSFGADIEVITPPNIRKMIQCRIQEMLVKYRGKSTF